MRFSRFAISTSSRIWLLAGLLVPIVPGAQEEEAEPAMLEPVHPRELLQRLPMRTTSWKLVRSEGRSVYDGGWKSVATREFVQIQRPELVGKVAPREVTFQVTDLAGDRAALRLFARFYSPQKSGRVAMISWKGEPIRYLPREDGTTDVAMLFGKRFLFRMRAVIQSPDDLRPWLDRSRLDDLANLPREEIDELPLMLDMHRIDEVDPSRTRSYQMHVGQPFGETDGILGPGRIR